ncbi:MAG: DEAD/DEAH box helicase [Clostridia bacterium]|nr:DEAD/DEAH box helicase [Clostridia bacterium]
MRLNPMLMEKLAGEEEFSAGRDLEESGAVKVAEEDRGMIRYTIAGTPPQTVTLTRQLVLHCSCGVFLKKGCCRHAVAAWLTADRTKVIESMMRKRAPEIAGELTELILKGMPGEANIHLEMTLALPQKAGQELRAGLRIGEKKLYVVKDIPAFLAAMDAQETLVLGKDFTWQPEWMRFSSDDEGMIRLLKKLCSAQEAGHRNSTAGNRMIALPDPFAEEMLEQLGETPLRVMDQSGKILRCRLVRNVPVPLHFMINLGPRGLQVSGRIPPDLQPVTESCSWVLTGGNLIRTEAEQGKLIRLLWQNQYEGRCLMEYPLKETERVIGEVLPYLKIRGAVEIGEELRKRLVRLPLKAEVYLDKEGKSVIATVRFLYGEIELNPFGAAEKKIALDKGEKLLLRDAEGEHLVLEILANAGFRVGKENIRLSGTDAIFDFVGDGVRRLQEVSVVYLSRDFKRMIPRRPALSGSMRMNGDKLELMLTRDGEPVDEILELIEALSRKRRYFRLRSGEFLDLNDLAGWQEAAAGIYEAAVRDGNELNRDAIVLRAYRAGYLTSMLENSGLKIELDENVTELTETLKNGGGEAAAPALAPGIALRDYQKRGYDWMFALDRMRMGGILADDMGLGKTAQIIALLQTTREAGRTSLVVAPTSLTYNWLSEFRKFAPDLSVTVLTGNGTQRAGLIRHFTTHGDMDVVITSYPLIRRDIALMKDYPFRFVILDEAQNIKNAGSVAAQAVKQLQADTRFALTGTPMENGVGELWSLFDFVLPGYLPGYNTFLRKYQDGENAEDLLRRIHPFLIRRLKQDVLEELPDKMETTLTARMTPEQERIYRASLERLRPRIDQLMDEKGGRAKIEVLSAITELREICCHPSLVMSDYRGGSGKEELLIELLPEMIRDGRRVLLFSQFTSMLKLLKRRLEENGFTTLYLDGDTPAGDRLNLTERFNQGEGEIFLISLKAGGYGLNLTGADMVILYDPWWNPATEEQATDRAHRIGQEKKVQVVRLITGETIEEQVVELGNRKKALFERLITPGESILSALTEQEIRNLFA